MRHHQSAPEAAVQRKADTSNMSAKQPPQFQLAATSAADKATKAPDYKALAKEAHKAITTCKTADLDATLCKLNHDSKQIAEFKRVYLSMYNTPVETIIKSHFSGDDLVSIGKLLGHSGDMKSWGQTHEVSNKVSEKISNAPKPYTAWNGTFSWKSKYQLYFNHDQNELVVRLKLHSSASDPVKEKWKKAVENKWGDKFKLSATDAAGKTKTYGIKMQVDWMAKSKDAHYDIAANKPGAKEGGRAGNGGTTSMTGWGTNDTTDVPHEVGHMLGAVEDYFTTDGVDHTHGGKKKGFRDKGGGIMNNPAEDPFAKHYESIRKEAAKALKIDAKKCKIVK